MNIFFSVGEPSGDLHASNLISQLKSREPQLQAVGFGGPKMAEAGCQLHFDLTTLAVMFLAGAIKNLRTFFKLIADAENYFATHRVDAVVLIDYPGFNWWIARKAKKHNIPVFYYGVPQMWAWAPWRIRKIRKFVDFVICKLPFEPKWFAERNCNAFYVGHPYFDQLNAHVHDDQFIHSQSAEKTPLVLLLPGSRNLEVDKNLDTLLNAAKKVQAEIPAARIVVGCFSEPHQQIAQAKCENTKIATFVSKTPELMQMADACIACSGSVSLELLHYRVPSVIVYRIGLVKYAMQAILIRCKFITLPNLMATQSIERTGWSPYDPDAEGAEEVLMPEYLTWKDCSDKAAAHVIRWLRSKSEHLSKTKALDRLAKEYAKPGATIRAADYIIAKLGSEASNSSAAA